MINEILKDFNTGMSKFQEDYFVTCRESRTLYGQYKQAMRETYKRYRGLMESLFERKRTDIEIARLKHNSENLEDKFDRQIAQIDYDEKLLKVEEQERVIKDTKREFLNFYSQLISLKEQLGELTEEKKAKLEQDHWVTKVKEYAALDILSGGRISKDTIELLQTFPMDLKQQILTEVKDHNKLIEWYENDTPSFLPDKPVALKSLEHIIEEITC
ncbi:MAG: hypothetical protein U9N86_10860 [Bacteroidota bacterium]|nr:hypothetical protein [Bacteroidota bacterium]